MGGSVSVDGGAVYNAGSLCITGTSLSNNKAPFGQAGAVDNLGSLTLANVTLQANQAFTAAGGILNERGAVLLLTGDTLIGNTAGADAGGIDDRGTIGMSNSALQTNVASGRAGGLYNEPGAYLLASDDTISGNQAGTDGGGIYNAGRLDASQITITGNRAPFGSGAGIFNVAGALTLTDVLVRLNASGAQTAPNGAAASTMPPAADCG